ncbi:MAG: hypothetical protein L0H36_01830 [bacterium]|nr:hypothetical protein [bacterium]
MEKDNVINLENYRTEKQKRQNPSGQVEDRLNQLDYPSETVEAAKLYSEILADEGMTNEDIAEALLDQYSEIIETPYDEAGSSLENLSAYREKQKRELGANAIEDTIYVIYGGGESESVPVHTSRNHLKVVDNSTD